MQIKLDRFSILLCVIMIDLFRKKKQLQKVIIRKMFGTLFFTVVLKTTFVTNGV